MLNFTNSYFIYLLTYLLSSKLKKTELRFDDVRTSSSKFVAPEGLNNATGYAGRHRARRHLAARWNERRDVLSQQRRPAMMRDGREGGRRHGNCRLRSGTA